MTGIYETVALSAVIGLSIFLSLPVVLYRKASARSLAFLSSVAIGILVFLVADVFSDVNVSTSAGSNLALDTAFIFGLSFAFLLLYFMENKSRKKTIMSPARVSLIIALGIGFQNLTEGLVFGANYSTGLIAISAVIFVGYILQNVTEGFPIASPFLSHGERNPMLLSGFFLIGGIPTIIGGMIGFYYNVSTFNVLFDGVAIGSILYILIPMLIGRIKSVQSNASGHELTYIGIFVGFLVGFVVNII